MKKIFNRIPWLGLLSITAGLLAWMLVAVAGRGDVRMVPFPPERKAIDIGDYYGEYGLIREELEWEPKVSLADGLSRTVQYYLAHHARYWS